MAPAMKEPATPSKWALLGPLLLSLFAVFAIWSVLGEGEESLISYSAFKGKIREGAFAEVKLSGSEIEGITKEEPPKKYRAVRIEDSKLLEELEAQGVAYWIERESNWIAYLLPWLLPLVLLWFFIRAMGRGLGGLGSGPLAIGKSRAQVYIDRDTGVSFADVAGVDEAKEELEEVIDFLKEPKKFQRLGGKIPKGVLLVGPPGTGKTLLARAVAGEAKVPFFSLSGSDFVEMFVGVGAARVRDLFSQAMEKAPCIVFIDELDAVGKVRSLSPASGGHEEREHTLQQLLVEMDGFDPHQGVILMAATNRPEILDPALLRPGRFDRQVLVDRPDISGRDAILKVHCRRIHLGADVDLAVLAARTPGFVGADLANVVNEGALLAARKGKDLVEMRDLEEAIDRVVAGLEKKKRLISPEERKVIAYHESGHALVAEALPGTNKVHRISIIPRGIAALGYTLQLPTEERYLLTREELMNRITVFLGGRAAEEMIFQEISTGAQDDLEKGTRLAHSMVTEYGMSETLGPLSYGTGKHFLIQGSFPDSMVKPYSEQTARDIDHEVRKLVQAAYTRAKSILNANLRSLEKVAEMLLEKETLEGDQLREILQQTSFVVSDTESPVPLR